MWISECFTRILNMSLTASIVILVVLAARFLLRHAPKSVSYLLWAAVLFRLLCPFSISTAFSLFGLLQPNVTQTGALEYVSPELMNLQRPAEEDSPAAPPPAGAFKTSGSPKSLLTAAALLWVCGLVVLLIYSVVALVRLRRRLVGAGLLRDNIYLADHITSPFVIGIVRAKIYLPSGLPEAEYPYIIQHEQYHIHRFDHVVKLLAFASLCIHWFNPLVWLAFVLSGKDMEMSCDEAVIRRMGETIRADYSASLLSLATGRKIFASTPLAFGEGDTKSRIKNVMNYRKATPFAAAAGFAVVLVLCIFFAVNPQKDRDSMKWARQLRADDIEKVELVVMPADPDTQYHLFETSEYPAIAALIRESSGNYRKNPESVAGGGITFYVTLKDGTRHSVCNSANESLIIDGDSYDADGHWLETWDYTKGDAPLPEGFRFSVGRLLTPADLRSIARKGEQITWDDFAPYAGDDIGFGLYIVNYPMSGPYYVRVGGPGPTEPPWYVRLYSADTEAYIDLRTQSPDDFLDSSR